MALTKEKIIKAVQANGFLHKEADYYVEAVLKSIKDTLASGDDVLIREFGKFCVNDKRGRRGRNPATGDDMILRSRKVVTFRCSK